MNSAADMGRHSGRATPSLHDAPYRQSKEATGRRSTYPLPIPVQTNPATSYFGRASAIIKQRERIKRQTIEHRRLQHRKLAA